MDRHPKTQPQTHAPTVTPGHTLPTGTVIGGLTISGLIGEGGFGIVYLAYDPTLQRQVALKEYMPASLAARGSNSTEVTVRSENHVDTFNAGLRSFVNEARLLARFDHPALVKVHQFWQANRTAYMVMPYYQGSTLKAHIKAEAAMGRRPDEATLRQWLTPLLNALEVMHAEQCYHRDIAPDNILLTPNGPLLLDFGAARRVISDMTHALTVILKPGYAPIEQYGEAASMTQGPWTDLYALASVIYFAITGHSPITSVERMMGDPLPRLAVEAKGRYSETFLNAIDAALAVKPADRPQSVAEFRALLDGTAAPRERTVTVPAPPPPVVAKPPPPPPEPPKVAAPRPMPPVPPPAPAATASRLTPLAWAIALLAVAVAGSAWFLRRGDTPAAGAPVVGTTAAPPAAAPAPAPAPVAAPAASAVLTAAPAAAEPAPPPAVVVKPAPAPKPKASAPVRAPMKLAPEAAKPAPPPASPPVAKPAAPPGKPPRCAELMQKGQQGTLSLEEATFLRSDCR